MQQFNSQNQSFLSLVWEEIAATPTPENLTVILPSSRACFYLKQIAIDASEESILLPNITTLASFASQFYNHTSADNLTLLLILFDCYQDLNPSETHSFQQFAGIGKNILSDFNEIDLQLADAASVYQNLRNIKDLEAWDIDELNIGASQENYNRFWQKLSELYSHFNTKLDALQLSYTGKKFKALAQQKITANGQFIFAGFNILSQSEQLFIANFLKQGKLIFEKDLSFATIKNHESLQKTPAIYNKNRDSIITTEWVKHKPKIKTWSAENNLAQILALRNILEKKSQEELKNTCIILPEASILPTLLQNLPANVTEANITMGQSLTATPWISYLQNIASALSHVQQPRFSINHIYTLLFPPKTAKQNIQLSYQNPSISLQELQELIPASHLAFLLCQLQQSNNYLDVIQHWAQQFLDENNKEETYTLQAINEVLTYVEQTFLKYGKKVALNGKLFLELVLTELAAYSIPIKGNPLQGPQIMGMLELRNLDFDTIIMLSVNEGQVPASVSDKTLIPNDLRKYFHLPSISDKEQLYGYYFYRLFYRTKELHLLYTESSDSLKSRYLTQLEFELPSVEKHSSFQHQNIHINHEIVGEKGAAPLTLSPDLAEKFEAFLTQRGVSASSLQDLIDCPKNFVLTHLLRAPEEELLGEISNASFGNILHDVLDIGYKKLIEIKGSKTITSEDFDILKSTLEAQVQTRLLQDFSEKELESGNAFILKQQVLLNLNVWLNFEKSQLKQHQKIELLGLEELLQGSIPITWNGKKLQVKIKGKIDRIQKVGDQIQLIDYKSGKVESKDLKLSTDKLFDKKGKFGLQLSLYAVLYFLQHQEYAKGYIYSFVKNHLQYQELVLSEPMQGEALCTFFTKEMQQLFSKINQEEPIFHNPAAQYCELC